MPIKVRVQNFQSIKDATLVVDGLTVLTGPNNSGKTAFMRAVRGVFTNPAASALVRHGEAHLTVTLTFDEGTVVVWEKGWEKPDQKGKSVNRYIINGKELNGVDRGAPPEIHELGVREIQAASTKIWPQIADQFSGTLFLVDKTGSSVAEALSDVEKVGKLTSALRLSERDRRSAEDELKIRRADADVAQKKVEKFKGLDKVSDSVEELVVAFRGLSEAAQRIREAQRLRGRLVSSRAATDALKGFENVVPSPPEKAQKIRKALEVCRELNQRLKRSRSIVSSLGSFSKPVFPDQKKALDSKRNIEAVRILSKTAARSRFNLEEVVEEEARLKRGHEQALAEVHELLGDRGICPVCETVHQR